MSPDETGYVGCCLLALLSCTSLDKADMRKARLDEVTFHTVDLFVLCLIDCLHALLDLSIVLFDFTFADFLHEPFILTYEGKKR